MNFNQSPQPMNDGGYQRGVTNAKRNVIPNGENSKNNYQPQNQRQGYQQQMQRREPPANNQCINNNAPPSDLPQHTQSDEPKRYMNIKSHGKSNAIEFAPDNTQKGWDTLRIEAAPKLGGNTKAYDWANKISVQITKTELPIVVAVLLGFLPSCEFGTHGDTAKLFSIENQGKSFYMKVGQASDKRMLPCPVPFVEAHLAGMVALSQYTKNFEGMTTDAAIEAIKVMSSHMVKNEAFPQARQINRGR